MALHLRIGRHRAPSATLSLHSKPPRHWPRSILSASPIPRITQKTAPLMQATIRTSAPK